MGLRQRIAALALREVRVLLVEQPGWALTRIAAERALAARGWRAARSAADADALLCCGEPGPEFDQLVERLFAQLPRPRAWERADHPDGVAAALDQILAALRAGGFTAAPTKGKPARAEDADMNHADMGGGDMSGPGGIPLAGGDQDRDGLEMDVLSVRLGPVLPAWPAGLELSVTLAGDLITDSHAGLVGLDAETALPLEVSRHEHAALAADRIGWLLLLAGTGRAERQLRQVRDGLLDGAEIAWCTGQLRRLADGLARSRSLRWSLRGLGRIDQGALQELDLPRDWSGDVLDRLHRRLSGLSELVDELTDPAVRSVLPKGPSINRAQLDLMADTVRGLDLGAARLVISSVDIDLTGGVGSTQSAVTARPGGSS